MGHGILGVWLFIAALGGSSKYEKVHKSAKIIVNRQGQASDSACLFLYPGIKQLNSAPAGALPPDPAMGVTETGGLRFF